MAEKLRIGIDAHAAERDGSGNCTYIRNLLLALKEVDSQNDYILYVTEKDHPFYQNFAGLKNFQVKQLFFRTPFLRIPLSLGIRSFLDGLDVLHVQYNAPPMFKGKLVVTIHDLSFLHYPEFFSRWDRLRMKWLTRFTAHKAALILTGSYYSEQDIITTYGVSSSKVKAVPYGVSSGFSAEHSDAMAQRVLEKFQINKPFILFVGRLNPRKNLESLLKAHKRLRDQHLLPHMLVIVGREDYRTQDLMDAFKGMSGKEKSVLFTGFVPEDELTVLYAQAQMFMYLSFFEGVGLPVLEAMSSGTPVIASASTSLKEIVGDAGILVDPNREDEIVQAVVQLAKDEFLRSEYRKRGFIRSKDFSWDITAQEAAKIYNELCL